MFVSSEQEYEMTVQVVWVCRLMSLAAGGLLVRSSIQGRGYWGQEGEGVLIDAALDSISSIEESETKVEQAKVRWLISWAETQSHSTIIFSFGQTFIERESRECKGREALVCSLSDVTAASHLSSFSAGK